MSKIRSATNGQVCDLNRALDALREVRQWAKKADCPKFLAKVRAAIRSGEGARRHLRTRMDFGSK